MRDIQDPTAFSPPTEGEVMQFIHQHRLWPYFVRHEPGEVYPAHYHQTDETLFLLEGQMEFKDKQGKLFAVSPGQKLVIPEGTVHSVTIGAQGAAYIMGLGERIPLEEFPVFLPPARPEFIGLLETNYLIAEKETSADDEQFFRDHLSKDLRFVRAPGACDKLDDFISKLPQGKGLRRVSRRVDLKAVGEFVLATLFVEMDSGTYLNVRVFRKEQDGAWRCVRWANLTASAA
jgi:hypothetical protein